MSKKKLNCNRHTRHFNAFKKRVIKRGHRMETKDGRIYYQAYIGTADITGHIHGGYCLVRTA